MTGRVRAIIGRIQFWMMEGDRWFLLIAAGCLAIIAAVGIVGYDQQERQITAIAENRRVAIQNQGRMEELAFWQKDQELLYIELSEKLGEERGRMDTLERLVTELLRKR